MAILLQSGDIVAEPMRAGRAPAAGCRASVPPSLRTALDARPGMPLPGDVAQAAQAHFDYSFADVRIHADGEAARMAADVRARAFTLGRHIVFGSGRYQPGSRAGAALLWHELAHVPAPKDPATLLRAPLYRTEELRFTPPLRGLTEPQMHLQLDRKVTKSPPDITGWSIKGATPKEEAYIFLEAALFEFGEPDRWDSVSRLEMELGWGTGAVGIIPTGLVTITIDTAGHAVAELVSRASIALSPSLSSADAVKSLKADFGIDVIQGDKAWQQAELDDVVQALGLLRGIDRAALRGVQLMRFAALPGGHAGEFSPGGGVAKGATTVQALPTLKLADSAFPRQRFALGPSGGTPLPGSEQTILHEVGHAVEQAFSRAALEKADTKVIGQNAAVKALDVAVSDAQKAAGTAGAQKSIDEYARRRAAYEKASAAARLAKAAHAATLVPAAVLAPLESDVKTKKAAHAAARKSAATASVNAGDASASLPYRSAADALAALIDDYTAKAQPGTELDPMDDALDAARAARQQARADLARVSPANPALAAFAAVDVAQDDWDMAARTLGHTRGRTRRLQKFKDLVTASGIRPLTKYARDKWPLKPQEFYAETYSLWLTEPDFLKTNYPELFSFFESGDYAK